MHHFFVGKVAIEKSSIQIGGSEAHHMIHVLRMQIGEKCTVSDGVENSYLCKVEDVSEKEVTLSILESFMNTNELPCDIYLFQGLPKVDKMEWVVQKAVELGVHSIIPVAMQNCVVKLTGVKGQKKVDRWQEIARSAAKQSKRTVIPTVQDVLPFSMALEYAKGMDVILLPYEEAEDMRHTRKVISSLKKGQTIGVFIGPEGGFSKSEIGASKECAKVITLGKRILRTETAGLAVLSILGYQLEQ